MSKWPALAFAVLVSVFAQADEGSIPTRFGELKTNQEGVLQFNGHPLDPNVTLFSFSGEVLATYQLDSRDVVFISQPLGNSCPGWFVFVTVSKEGAKATPKFGTCYDDTVTPVQSGQTIAFSMKKLGGKGSVRYLYKGGIVYENGKPVKPLPTPP